MCCLTYLIFQAHTQASTRSHHGQQRCVCEKCSSIPIVVQRQSCLDQLIDGLSHNGVRFTSQFCIIFDYLYGLSFMVLNFPPGFITPEREPQLVCAA